jgi:hypothetical protein
MEQDYNGFITQDISTMRYYFIPELTPRIDEVAK